MMRKRKRKRLLGQHVGRVLFYERLLYEYIYKIYKIYIHTFMHTYTHAQEKLTSGEHFPEEFVLHESHLAEHGQVARALDLEAIRPRTSQQVL
jgi:hypothetical protein